MPNWCSNNLTITGTADAVAAAIALLATPYQTHHTQWDHANGTHQIVEGTQSGPLLFWNMVRPDDEDRYWGISDDPSTRSLLDWNIEHWGTKWELDESTTVETPSPTEVEYGFSTAWSPPLDAVAAFATAHPDLTVSIEYDEPGMDFSGRMTWTGGQVTEQREEASRSRWCHACEEPYYVEWDSSDTACPQWEDADPGTWQDRLHRATDPDATAEDLDRLARETSSNLGENPDAENLIQDAILSTCTTSRDTRIYLALHGCDDSVRLTSLRSFSADDIDEFNASADPSLLALASVAIVDRASH